MTPNNISLIKCKSLNGGDECYTPYYAVEPILKYIPKEWTIWECTDFGGSQITKALIDNGNKVISTHLRNFDFLKDAPTFEFDAIITNPPYTLKNEFLERCYKIGKPFAMLLPITALEGVRRGGLFRQYGIDVMVCDKRINFVGGSGNWFNASWFSWKILPKQLVFVQLNDNNQMRMEI